MGPVDTAGLSSFAILYFLLTLALSAACLISYGAQKQKAVSLDIPSWKASWGDFGLFLIIVYLMSWLAQAPFYMLIQALHLDDTWKSILPGLLAQALLLGFLALCLKRYPHFFGDGINLRQYRLGQALHRGVYGFFFALIPIALVSFYWNSLLNIAIHLGASITLEPQFLIKTLISGNSWVLNGLIGLFAALVAPITEELIFRAGIYRFLKGKVPARYALIISALLFAWGHMSLPAFLPLLFLGMFLGRLYESTGSILPCMCFHACFNINTLILLLGTEGL